MEMLMGKILKRLVKTIAVIFVLMYSFFVMVDQEVDFKKYDSELNNYNNMIAEEDMLHEQLVNTRSQISSEKYIEEVAREKLGLVMPNEVVFIDASL
jgi:cell division protein FtsB